MRPVSLIAATATCFLLFLFGGGLLAADPGAFLPEEDGWIADSPPRRAGDEATLFSIINGGAEQYIRHGFQGAVFRTYRDPEGRRYNVAIFQMKTPAAARAIYDTKGGDDGRPLDLGEEGRFADYYLVFREESYYVTITAMDPGEVNPPDMVETARSISDKLRSTINKR